MPGIPNFSFGYPGGTPSYGASTPSSGSGWASNTGIGSLGTLAGGASGGEIGGVAAFDPISAAIMSGGSLLSGIVGGYFAGKQKEKTKKAFQKQQKEYQAAASRLFPEMSKESFQYKNPELTNAVQGALAYRLGNMFSGWGMPKGMTKGQGELNQMFSNMMPKVPSYAYGGVATRPQMAMVGERGPEAIVPLGRYPRQGRAPNQAMPYPGMGGGFNFPQMRPMPGQGGMIPGGGPRMPYMPSTPGILDGVGVPPPAQVGGMGGGGGMGRVGLANPALYPQGGGGAQTMQQQQQMQRNLAIQQQQMQMAQAMQRPQMQRAQARQQQQLTPAQQRRQQRQQRINPGGWASGLLR